MVAFPHKDALEGCRDDIGVGEDGPLGNPRGSSRKLNQGRIFGVDLDPGPLVVVGSVDQGRKMMPPFFQIQAGGGAHAQAFDIIRDFGDDDPGDLHLSCTGARMLFRTMSKVMSVVNPVVSAISFSSSTVYRGFMFTTIAPRERTA